MRLRGYRRTLAALHAVLCLPWAATAQTGTPSVPVESGKKEARAPVPPGVPTTAENVHLPTEAEVKLGREGSVEVEKEYKILTSGPYHERLQRIAREVVEAMNEPRMAAEYRRIYKLPRKDDKSRRVPFEYTFKVADTTKEINAFALPGGPIYVTRGLMDYAGSDHELAGVLSHECAHVAFHHSEQMIRKARKNQSTQLWALLATVVAGAAGGGGALSAAGNIFLSSQYVMQAAMSGYSQDLEAEADRIGVLALSDTSYNPLGILTFMQKLARDDNRRGNPDFGIFQSHPYSNQRVAAIKKELIALGYRLDAGAIRQVNGSFRTEVEPLREDGRETAEVRLNGNLVFRVVAGEGDASPRERARRIAAQLSAMFADSLSYNDVRKSPDKTAVLLKGIPIIRVYPEDGEAVGGVEKAVDKAYNEIMRALLAEQLDKS